MHRAIDEFARDLLTKLMQFAHTQQCSCENKLLGIALEKQVHQQLQRKLGQISINGALAASAQRIKEVGEILKEKTDGHSTSAVGTSECESTERGGTSPSLKKMRLSGLSSSSTCTTHDTTSSHQHSFDSGNNYFLCDKKISWKFAKLMNQRLAFTHHELESNSCLLRTFVKNYFSDYVSASIDSRANESRYVKMILPIDNQPVKNFAS